MPKRNVPYVYIPSVKIVIRKLYIISNGINIAIIADSTINGPKGIYSPDFLALEISSNTLAIAPNKNAVTEIATMVFSPKNRP